MKRIEKLGFSDLPICMAKTQKSLSDNETAFGRPENFVVTVREFEHATGAGFIIPILGQMMRNARVTSSFQPQKACQLMMME